MEKSFWQGKRVFLTGDTGFKGAWLSLWLHKLGAVVKGYALDPLTQPSLYKIANISKIQEHIDGDIRDYEKLQQELTNFQPEIVFHLAAQALVRESYQNPLYTYETNVMGTANLLEAVRKTASVKAVLIITTDKCYENKEWHWAYRENDRLGGHDPYSNSKACTELVVDSYRKSFLKEKNIAVATARAGNVIGGGDWSKDRLIPDCLRSIKNKEKIVIRSPKAVRPWQHVLEPLAGYLNLAQRLYKEGQVWAEAWNFGPDEASTICVEEIVKHLCCEFVAEYEIKVDDIMHEATLLKLDCAKAKTKLNWQPKLTIQQALNLTTKWYQYYWSEDNVEKLMFKQIEEYELL